MQVNTIYNMWKSEVLHLYIQIYLFIIFEIGTERKIDTIQVYHETELWKEEIVLKIIK